LKKATVLLVLAFLSLSLSGCSSTLSDERLESFSLAAAGFGSGWSQANEDAGSINFSGDRVGDLCDLDNLLGKQGGESTEGPKMIISDGSLGAEEGDSAERIVYANLFSFSGSQQVQDAMLSIQSEVDSCSQGIFFTSTDDGILISESDTRTFTDISDTESLLGVSPDSVVAFDYIRVDSRSILNTNNDYSDDSEYSEAGRVIVISGPKSILLVTSGGRTFKLYEPAPAIDQQNSTLAEQLRELFG
jgi:hypothetical protein